MQILDDNVVAQSTTDIIEQLERAALGDNIDKSRTLNQHEGLAWIHTGEEILSKVFSTSENIMKVVKESITIQFTTRKPPKHSMWRQSAPLKMQNTRVSRCQVCGYRDSSHVFGRFPRHASVRKYRGCYSSCKDANERSSSTLVARHDMRTKRLIGMAEDAFENTVGVVNGDTTLDFTFGHGQDEECRNAISNACRKGLERLEREEPWRVHQMSNLSSGNGDVTYESLKRRLKIAIREDPSDIHARELLAQLLSRRR